MTWPRRAIVQALATAVLLGVASVGAAGGRPLANGVAESVDFQGEALDLKAPLEVLQLRGIPPEVTRLPFRMAAERIHVETDRLRGPGVGLNYFPGDVETSETDAKDVVVEGGARRPAHRLTIYPLDATANPEVGLIGNAGALRQADGSDIQVGFLVKDNRAPAYINSTGLQWVGLGGITVRGSFVLTMWEWDASVRMLDGSSREFRTGVQDSAVLGLPGATTPAARDSAETQTYFYVTNGTLTLPASVGILDLVVGSAHVGLQGNVHLTGVVGAVMDSASASFTDLTAAGSVVGSFQADANGIPFQLAATGPTTVEGDGQYIASVTVPSPKQKLPPLPLGIALLLLGVPAAAFGGRTAYLALETRRLDRAEQAMDHADYETAARKAAKLRGSRRYALEVELVYIEALIRQGDPAKAIEALGDDGPWPNAPAMKDYLLALANARLGKAEAALEALARSIRQAPVLLVQARQEGLLAPFLDEFPDDGYV